MKRIMLMCCAAAICCSACSHRTGQDENAASESFLPLQQTVAVTDFSGIIDTVSIIRVSEGEQFISGASKMLIDSRKNIYMLDDGGRLAAIKPDGTFLPVPSRRRAGNEYLSANDIALSDNELLILDDAKIKFYDLDDMSLKKTMDIPLSAPCDAIAPDGRGGVYLFSAFPSNPEGAESDKDFLLYRLNPEGELTDSYIQRKDITLSMYNISQACPNEYFLRPQNSSHIFYRLTADGPAAEYRMDFGDENIPHRYYYDSADGDLGAYMLSPYFKMPMELHQTADHIFMRVAGPMASENSILLGKNSKTGVRWTNAPEDMQVQIMASDGEFFYVTASDGIDQKEPHGPFYQYIAGCLAQNGQQADGACIVKIRFAAE